MEKITIIDGNSLLFRAYFATAYPGVEIMRNAEGIPTNAVFAFSNMINKIVSSLKEGERIIVAFDAAKHNFRHDQLETYKANRKPAPDDLVTQFPIARDFLRAFGVYQFEEVGFEGDDIAGTVAKMAEKNNMEVTIYTSDKDFLQLVSDKITVNLIKRGLSDVNKMTPTTVEEEFGFAPLQIIDYKGLRGDTSDNLPGIPGIGEKTAVKLIQEYGNFDNIINNADNIKGKIGEAIKEHQDMGRLCRDLAIIQTNIDLPFTLNDTIYQGYEFNKINEFCQKYGLKQFMNKVSQKWKISDLSEAKIEVKKVDSYIDINIEDEIGIAIDIDGDYTSGDLLGIAIYNKHENYYIDASNAIKDDRLKEILASTTIKKRAFDYKAIKVNLAKYGIIVNGLEFDLLIASYLLDSALKNDPDQVMGLYGIDLGSSQDTVSLFSTQNVERTAKIAFFSYSLFIKANEELNKHDALKLFNEVELPLCETLAKMEIEGFPLDAKKLDEFGNEFKKKENELKKEIYQLAGEEFNIASPKQLGDILYNKLNLSSNKKMSTSIDNLKDLIDEHPIIEKIMEYRKYFKLITTYIDGLKPHIYPDGKIHAHFNQALTATGRLSSSSPNLQNISVRDEEGKQIRQAFYYPEEDIEILSLDYSQIELRILAYLANCEKLKDIFKSGEDIHSATAKNVFHIEGEPTPLQRRKAKAVNFGIIYGISNWGLAEQIESSQKEAQQIIESFYESFPEIRDFFFNIVEEAKKNGYVSTLLGRRRYLREINDSNYQTREFAKRAAMNAPIQGTAADLIKVAMIKVDDALNKGNYKSKMVLQIHDELIFKVYKDEKEEVYNLVKAIMEHALDISIPLEVDGGFGKDWYSAK